MSTLRTRMFGFPVAITEQHSVWHAYRGQYVDMIEVRYDMSTAEIMSVLPYDMRSTRAFIVDFSDRKRVAEVMTDAVALMVLDYKNAEQSKYDDAYAMAEQYDVDVNFEEVDSFRREYHARDRARYAVHADATGWAHKTALALCNFSSLIEEL